MRRNSSIAVHPQWKTWASAVRRSDSEDLENLIKNFRGTHERQSQRDPNHSYDYTDVLNDLFEHVGASLNNCTERCRDYRVSLYKVSEDLGIPIRILKDLYYTPNCLAKTVLDFDLETPKKSSLEALQDLLSNHLKTTLDWEKGGRSLIKDFLPDLCKEFRLPLKLRDKVQDLLDRARSVEEARTLLHGIKKDSPMRNKEVRGPVLFITYPWLDKESKKIQKKILSTSGKVASNIEGFTFGASIDQLKELNLLKLDSSLTKRTASDIRSLGFNLNGIEASVLQDGAKIVELKTSLPKSRAVALGNALVRDRKFIVAAVVDKTGKTQYSVDGSYVKERAITSRSLKEVEEESNKNWDGNVFDEDQLSRGIQVEMKNEIDPELAEEMAKSHLSEDPDYYRKNIVFEIESD